MFGSEELSLCLWHNFFGVDGFAVTLIVVCLLLVALAQHLTLCQLSSLFLFSVWAQAWVEGVKDVIEPFIILLLAWALEAFIQVGGASSRSADG